MDEKIKCGTWGADITPDVRQRMRADRALAEAKQAGCTCASAVQSYACPAYDVKKCIHHPEVVAFLNSK